MKNKQMTKLFWSVMCAIIFVNFFTTILLVYKASALQNLVGQTAKNELFQSRLDFLDNDLRMKQNVVDAVKEETSKRLTDLQEFVGTSNESFCTILQMSASKLPFVLHGESIKLRVDESGIVCLASPYPNSQFIGTITVKSIQIVKGKFVASIEVRNGDDKPETMKLQSDANGNVLHGTVPTRDGGEIQLSDCFPTTDNRMAIEGAHITGQEFTGTIVPGCVN